jgi:hypothetical protein
MKVFGAILSVLVAAMGCAENREVATKPESGFDAPVLNTAVGSVDVLSIADHAGFREVLLHHVGDDGVHRVRTLEVRNREIDLSGRFEVEYRLLDKMGETCRWVQSHEESPAFVEIEIHSGGDFVRWGIKQIAGGLGVRVEATRAGTSKQAYREVEPTHFKDADYLEDLKQDFRGLYPSGPLRDGPELQLLSGVVQSEDWARYLTPATDDEAQERLRKVCVAAAVTAKIACFAAKFLPWAWVACVPASGVSIACLAYQIQREFVNPQPGGCSCECVCAP